MNRIILPLDKLLPSSELNKLLHTSKSVQYSQFAEIITAYDNVKKVYFVVEGCLGIRVENRYRKLKLVAEDKGAENVLPSDIVMASEVDAKIDYKEGSYVMFEHCLYEQLLPMTLYAKTEATLIEVDGNLFKAMFLGNRD